MSARIGNLEVTFGRTQRPFDTGECVYSMDPEEQEQVAAELRVRVTEKYLSEHRVISVRTLDVHPGPQKWKTVSLLVIGDAETGEVKKQELRVQTWARKPLGARVRATTSRRTSITGTVRAKQRSMRSVDSERAVRNRGQVYVLIREESDVTKVVEAMGAGGIDAEILGKLIELAGENPDAVAAVASSPGAPLVAEAVELERRRLDLAELKRIVEYQNSTERDDIHPQLRKMGWIFGGRYVGEARRKDS